MKYCQECRSELVLQEIDGVARYSCSSRECDYVVWDNPVPVVAGLVFYNEQALLARNSSWPKNVFSVITGYLERNESPELAITREVKEELGLTATNVDFIGHFPFTDKNQLIIAFAITGDGEIQLNDEISDTRLINISDLLEYDFGMFKLTRKIVDKWAKDVYPSQTITV